MLTEMMATAGARNGFEEGEDGIRCLERPRTEEDGTLQIDRLLGLDYREALPGTLSGAWLRESVRGSKARTSNQRSDGTVDPLARRFRIPTGVVRQP